MEKSRFVKVHILDNLPIILGANSECDWHLFIWAIEDYVAIGYFRLGVEHIACYENFPVLVEYGVSRLSDYLGKPIDPKIFDDIQRSSAAACEFDRYRLQADREAQKSI